MSYSAGQCSRDSRVAMHPAFFELVTKDLHSKGEGDYIKSAAVQSPHSADVGDFGEAGPAKGERSISPGPHVLRVYARTEQGEFPA
ncbi:hypothetical protein TNCV_1414571 [Trichonephila clavipes]|nr:hypothetical protein TNCV_1414571 [Trichonephila clavipes]